MLYDVVIAGAGPVGLFLAAELAQGGAQVLVLEQSAEADTPLKRLPFGLRGLNAPTLEALDRRGLLQAVAATQVRKPDKG
ncbi:MAG TPA: FAD-dependent oxidoreductase, partial [Stenotrophomonas sp.]|nr:FAD-dependent oxidoreductase [Stenotrophomonas sp.]